MSAATTRFNVIGTRSIRHDGVDKVTIEVEYEPLPEVLEVEQAMARASVHAQGVGPALAGMLVDIEVDPNGKIQVLRCTVAQDAGRAIHPGQVEARCRAAPLVRAIASVHQPRERLGNGEGGGGGGLAARLTGVFSSKGLRKSSRWPISRNAGSTSLPSSLMQVWES